MKPNHDRVEAAGVLGMLLRDVGYSLVIDRLLDAQVAKAREQVERAPA